MKEYHKIQTVFKRDMSNKGQIILDEYSMPEFKFLEMCPWVFTEKVDGTNVRVIFDGNDVKFGGKTDKAKLHNGLYTRLRDLFPIEKMKAAFPECTEVCLYGEGYGEKIQSGGKYKNTQDFVLFDVKVGTWWLERINVEGVANNLSIDAVPIVGTGTLRDLVTKVRDGMKSTWGNFIAEGIVAKPSTELFNRKGERVITKLKHEDFR